MTKPGPLQAHVMPPAQARLTTIMLEPVTLAEHKKTGDYWKRSYIGPHVPARDRDPAFWSDVFGEPELWHFESIMWRRRSILRPLLDAAARADAAPLSLVTLGTSWSADDVERFWRELVPFIGGDARQNLDNLPDVVEQVEQRFTRQERRQWYRMLNRFALILVTRLEPLYLHRGRKPEIDVPTYFHLWMLAHHIIGEGQAAYLAAVAEPRSVSAYIPALTNDTGLFALGLFRYEESVFEAQKLRLIETYTYPHDPARKAANAEVLRSGDLSGLPPVERWFIEVAQRVSGFFNVVQTLRERFQGPRFARGYPELYPTFRELPNGEIECVRYGALSADTPVASDIKSLPHEHGQQDPSNQPA